MCLGLIRFRCYHSQYHHVDAADDGYMWVYDSYKERRIYVCKREVGRSRYFLEEFAIRSFVDLIRTNDEHSNDLSLRGREKVYRQICRIVEQLSNSEGNVVVFCGRGRTRSPVHVAAYF